MPIPWLGQNPLRFPDPDSALDSPDGLLAVGGDLSPSRLLAAYAQGIFPWYNPGDPLLWWSPSQRCVIQPARFSLSRSLRKTLRHAGFDISMDHCFDQVIQACAAPRTYADGTWIVPEMQAAYLRLHALGQAHSVEVWHDSELVGGLYGVALGRLFCGESMFSTRRDSSKVALAYLCAQLHAWGFGLIDCQMHTPHLQSLGAYALSRTEYLARISELLRQKAAMPERQHWQLAVCPSGW